MPISETFLYLPVFGYYVILLGYLLVKNYCMCNGGDIYQNQALFKKISS